MMTKEEKEQVIGVGSYDGWTREGFYQELSRIRDAAGLKTTTEKEWESMERVLAGMYVGCSDNTLAMTIFNYLESDFSIRKSYADKRRYS